MTGVRLLWGCQRPLLKGQQGGNGQPRMRSWCLFCLESVDWVWAPGEKLLSHVPGAHQNDMRSCQFSSWPLLVAQLWGLCPPLSQRNVAKGSRVLV